MEFIGKVASLTGTDLIIARQTEPISSISLPRAQIKTNFGIGDEVHVEYENVACMEEGHKVIAILIHSIERLCEEEHLH